MMIFKSKLSVNLIITIPCILINGLILGICLKMTGYELLVSMVMPMVYAVFISILGLVLGLQYPNFEWKSEMAVVKQGIPVIVTMLIGMATTIAPIGLLTLMKTTNPFHIYLEISVIMAIITSIVYRYLKVKGSKRFLEIG